MAILEQMMIYWTKKNETRKGEVMTAKLWQNVNVEGEVLPRSQ